MIFLVLLRKMILLFPENMILPPGRKMKDDLSQKNTWYFFYDIFFQMSEKMVFSKRLHWNMIFLVLSGKVVFFSRKHDIFSLGGGRRVTFLEKYMVIWQFLYTRVGVTNVTLRPPAKKIKDDFLPQKYT